MTPSSEAKVVPNEDTVDGSSEEPKRRRAALIALFLPLMLALAVAVVFVMAVVGPRLSAARRVNASGGRAAPVARTFAQDQARLAAESKSQPPAASKETLASAGNLTAARKAVSRVSRSGGSVGRRSSSPRRGKAAPMPEVSPSDGGGTDAVTPLPPAEELYEPAPPEQEQASEPEGRAWIEAMDMRVVRPPMR